MPTKNPRRWTGTLLLVLSLSWFAGCGKKEPAATSQPPQAAEPAKPVATQPQSDFEAVTSRLDPGGDVYVYLGTADAMEQLGSRAGAIREMLLGMPDLDADSREKVAKTWNLVTNAFNDSGIRHLRGVGMSSLRTGDGMRRSKVFLYHPESQGDGFAWNVFGAKPHALDFTGLLSTNTALAMYSDADLLLAWSVLRKHLSALPEVQKMVEELPGAFSEATGLEWEAVLKSLGGAFGLVLTLDAAKTVSVPMGEEALEIPEPALMIAVKVNDDTIFKRLDQALKDSGQSVFNVNKPGLQMRTLALPIPLPLQVGLTVAQTEGYLFLATTDQIVLQALAVRAKEQQGLTSTPEFQRLAKDVPGEGNQFTFVSERLGETVRRVQRQALRMAESMGSEQQKVLRALMREEPPMVMYSVGGHTAQGWLVVANGNQHPGGFLLNSAILPALAAAGVAAPSMRKGEATQNESCRANLRSIGAAKEAWALENKDSTEAPDTFDLLPYLPGRELPSCPDGGEYTVGDQSVDPTCSVHSR